MTEVFNMSDVLKISELEIGTTCQIPLVVTSATPSLTKAKKKYLSLKFFDGTDAIAGNYWDWNGLVVPEKNTIVDVRATVGAWQGNKQLNINGMSLNKEMKLSDFAPQSGLDISAVYREAYVLATDICDDDLRGLTLFLLEHFRDDWLEAPAARSIHHAYVGGLLVHSLSVAKIAKAIALTKPTINVDLCVAGGLLHDIGKMQAYKLDGVVIEMTDEGMLYDHLFIGAEMIGHYAYSAIPADSGTTLQKIELLRHMLLSHHGALEHGAVVPPQCIEAHIVFHADMLDAISETVSTSSRKVSSDSKWTEKIWSLSNRPNLTIQYVHKVMAASTNNINTAVHNAVE